MSIFKKDKVVRLEKRLKGKKTNQDATDVSLVDLVASHFAPLSAAEKAMLKVIETGNIADFKSLETACDFTVRGTLIRWLFIAKTARDRIDAKGIQLYNARVVGYLDLESVQSTVPLILKNCLLPEGVSLQKASFPSLDLSGSMAGRVDADYLTCNGSFVLTNGFRCNGPFFLRGARIGGNVNLDGAKLVNPAGESLTILYSTIGTSLLFRNEFRALGKVRIMGGSIGGVIQCDGGRFAARRDFALTIESVRIQRAVMLKADSQKMILPFRALGGVRLYGSAIDGNLVMTGAILKASKREALDAAYTKIGGSVFLKGRFASKGKINFYSSEIGSDFNAAGARLINRGGITLSLINATIGRSLILQNGFRSVGQVRILGGTIGGVLQCEGGHFCASRTFALTIESVKMKGPCLLRRGNNGRRFRASGGVRLYGNTIDGNLDLSDSVMVSRKREALQAPYLKVTGSMFFNGLAAFGKINLYACEILTDFIGNQTHYKNVNRVALDLSASRVKGNIWLAKSKILGSLGLSHASIGHSLYLGKTRIQHNECSIYAANLEVAANVCLNDGFSSVGRVDFSNAKVGCDFNGAKATFNNRSEACLTLLGARVGGNLDFDSSTAFGVIVLKRAAIGGDFNCNFVQFSNPKGTSLMANRVAVGGSAFMSQGFNVDGGIDLRDAAITRIEDTEGSWPDAGKLRIDGLTYDKITQLSAETRLRWLDRQWESGKNPGSRFLAQPYEQLIKTMRRNGHEKEARRVAIAKQRAVSCTLNGPARVLHCAYGFLMDYGYRPQKSLWFAPVFVLGLTFALKMGAATLMVPSKVGNDTSLQLAQRRASFRDTKASAPRDNLPKSYPSFNSFAYAVDTFVPVINLQQKDNWQPDDKACCSEGPVKCGMELRWYLWVHTILGWIITTLAVAGFTGLVRKD